MTGQRFWHHWSRRWRCCCVKRIPWTCRLVKCLPRLCRPVIAVDVKCAVVVSCRRWRTRICNVPGREVVTGSGSVTCCPVLLISVPQSCDSAWGHTNRPGNGWSGFPCFQTAVVVAFDGGLQSAKYRCQAIGIPALLCCWWSCCRRGLCIGPIVCTWLRFGESAHFLSEVSSDCVFVTVTMGICLVFHDIIISNAISLSRVFWLWIPNIFLFSLFNAYIWGHWFSKSSDQFQTRKMQNVLNMKFLKQFVCSLIVTHFSVNRITNLLQERNFSDKYNAAIVHKEKETQIN